jgi:hypothetical protein
MGWGLNGDRERWRQVPKQHQLYRDQTKLLHAKSSQTVYSVLAEIGYVQHRQFLSSANHEQSYPNRTLFSPYLDIQSNVSAYYDFMGKTLASGFTRLKVS